jgi:hypothetical protein
MENDDSKNSEPKTDTEPEKKKPEQVKLDVVSLLIGQGSQLQILPAPDPADPKKKVFAVMFVNNATEHTGIVPLTPEIATQIAGAFQAVARTLKAQQTIIIPGSNKSIVVPHLKVVPKNKPQPKPTNIVVKGR